MSTARQYELIYITAPDVTDEVLADLHSQIVAIAERFGGTVSKTENWGRKRLAYEIAGQREGVYVLEVIDGPVSRIRFSSSSVSSWQWTRLWSGPSRPSAARRS